MNGFWDKDQNSYFWPKFAPFTPFLGKWEFSEKKLDLSISRTYEPLTSCKKSEKTNERFLR